MLQLDLWAAGVAGEMDMDMLYIYLEVKPKQLQNKTEIKKNIRSVEYGLYVTIMWETEKFSIAWSNKRMPQAT